MDLDIERKAWEHTWLDQFLAIMVLKKSVGLLSSRELMMLESVMNPFPLQMEMVLFPSQTLAQFQALSLRNLYGGKPGDIEGTQLTA